MPVIETIECPVCGYKLGWLWQVCDEDKPDFYYCYKCGYELPDELVIEIGPDPNQQEDE